MAQCKCGIEEGYQEYLDVKAAERALIEQEEDARYSDWLEQQERYVEMLDAEAERFGFSVIVPFDVPHGEMS